MKLFKKLVCFAIAALTIASVVACSGGASGFELSHFDGSDPDKTYDTDLLYKNNTVFWGGDSGVIYVSPEQSAEYGGYFYQYMSECAGVANIIPSTEDGKTPPLEHNNNGPAAYTSHIKLTRSKDLNDWEPCGAVDDGMALRVDETEWVGDYLWAPECIYDKVSGKYFLYFSARSKKNNAELRALGAQYSDTDVSVAPWERFYLGIAVSDTPVGPFRLVSSENVYGDKTAKNLNGEVISGINPAFMLDKACDEYFYTDEFRARADFDELDEKCFAAIDIHPFIDDGTLYVYFVKHGSLSNLEGNVIWGMRMKDMVTPDYGTMTMVAGNGYTRKDIPGIAEGSEINKSVVRVEYKGTGEGEYPNDPNYPRHLSTSYTRYTNYADGSAQSADDLTDGSVVEAPQMLTTKDKDGKTVYLLAFSPRGVGDYNYNVKFAYSHNPLTGFVKAKTEERSMILGVDERNTFMSNLGHVQFLHVDGQDWIVHWEFPAPFGGYDTGRIYALSQMTWQYNEKLGFDTPVANGPTTSLQPLPSVFSGYRNVADRATVTATGEIDGSAKYLTDGMTVTMRRDEKMQFRAKNNKTKITLTFAEPVSVRGILIYNSYNYDNAFKNVSTINFSLTETPTWHTGNEKSCFIADLPFAVEAYTLPEGGLQPGSAAVATFNEIKTNKIEIEFDKDDMLGGGDELRIAEIVVLGK